MSVKRVAVATRWGMLKDGPAESWIKVHDPEDEGEKYTAEEAEVALLGVVRLHMGNLLAQLGHQELAAKIREVVRARTVAQEAAAGELAQRLVESAGEMGSKLRDTRAEAIGDAVVGGVVTRAGALQDRVVEETDLSVLAKLDMRPVFVGVSAEAVSAAISGNTEYFSGRLRQVVAESDLESLPSIDAAGKVVRLD